MKRSFEAIVFNNHSVGQYVRVHNFPKPGETIRSISWDDDVDGGKGTNVAMALGKLGISTAYFGKVGYDIWAEKGKQWFHEVGVNFEHMYQREDIQTSSGVVLIDDAGENVVVTRNTSISFLPNEIDPVLEKLKDSQYFITGFEIVPSSALYAAKKAKSLGMVTVLNPSPVPPDAMGDLSYIDILIVNLLEGLQLAGEDDDCCSNEAGYYRILSILMDRYHPRTVIMTLGQNGCVGMDDFSKWRLYSEKVDVVDSTGAGDAFLAALVASLIRGKNIEEACRWAGLYASLATTRLGTGPTYPWLSEMELCDVN